MNTRTPDLLFRFAAECPEGKFGEECLKTCACPGGIDCDKVNGLCYYGCKAGFSGEHCEKRKCNIMFAFLFLSNVVKAFYCLTTGQVEKASAGRYANGITCLVFTFEFVTEIRL